MKKLIVAIGLVIAIGFSFTSCKSEKKETKEVEKEIVKEVVADEAGDKDMALPVHKCPMDCEKGKTYDKPGQCPVCKMDLKEVKPDGDAEGHNH